MPDFGGDTYHCDNELIYQLLVVGKLAVGYIGGQLGHFDSDVAISLLFTQLDILDELLHLNALVGLLDHERKVNPLDHIREVVQLVFDAVVLSFHIVEAIFQTFQINRVL